MCNDPFFASPGLGRQFNAGFPGAVLVLPLEASTGPRRVSDLPCWDSGRFFIKVTIRTFTTECPRRQFNAGFPGAVVVLPLEATTGARRVSDLSSWTRFCLHSELLSEYILPY